MEVQKPRDFKQTVVIDGQISLLKTIVYLTIALGPGIVSGLENLEVSPPIFDRLASSKRNVDGIIGWQVPNEPLNVVRFVI